MSRQSLSAEQLSPASIAEAALRIIDTDGPDALSFRTLGRALDVSHMTVHRRCQDFAGLLDICVDHLAADLPTIDPTADWADASEARFTSLYDLIVAHPGLVALRRGRPWLGPRILKRLVEPALAANLAVGMTPRQMVEAYRRMYLFTLGAACFVDHIDPDGAVTRSRTALAALDPRHFPVLTGHMSAMLDAVVDHEVYRGGLRQLITAADPRRDRAPDG